MRTLVIAAAALCLAAGAAFAHDVTKGEITVIHPWTRAMPSGADVGGGFMVIANDGQDADRLLGLSSPRARMGEVHEMSMQDGVMKMRRLEGGLEIPAGDTVELKPGGYHVMFMGVAEGFREGEMIPAVLVFEKAGEVPIELIVGGVGAKTAPGEAE